ncbi:SRPBCC domain-containing protein [Homoserinibacter gongjuensis]|uniref:Activator of Hsp90 ATPase homologue 1/2-like C-terminal domain-containing protein n=1 Tax=Homoserinibacter gongjuensis TaxID=1162968 RepID=A0ABQ6JUG4_9MICO|nr:SRPBCC domain-containing protein [Homoserinibacter gongjuensis]GMA90306.1 hypothetical protein GCM10025869_08350 [Homoserinibacter gongjuensis]
MTDDRIYEVEVAAPPQKVWEALTEPHTVRRYYYGTSPRTTWEVGSPVEFVDDDGDVQIEGVVLAFEPLCASRTPSSPPGTAATMTRAPCIGR